MNTEANFKKRENTRIAVFYDGAYFSKISDHYCKTGRRGASLSYKGLHEFIKSKVADLEERETTSCRVVDARFFRGKFKIADHAGRNHGLVHDRLNDEAMMEANIIAHYLPMVPVAGTNTYSEKGIDVWFALEAFELTMLKKYEVVVLITGDSDHLPLMRKLTALDTRVMLLYWNVEEPAASKLNDTFTSRYIIEAATYAVNMGNEIEQGKGLAVIENLFVPQPVNRAERPRIKVVHKPVTMPKPKPEKTISEKRLAMLRHNEEIAKIKSEGRAIVLTPDIPKNTNSVKKVIQSGREAIKQPSITGVTLPPNEIIKPSECMALSIIGEACTALIHIPVAPAVIKNIDVIKKRIKDLTGKLTGKIVLIDFHRGIGKVSIGKEFPAITFYCNTRNKNNLRTLRKNILVEFELKRSAQGTFAINLRCAAA